MQCIFHLLRNNKACLHRHFQNQLNNGHLTQEPQDEDATEFPEASLKTVQREPEKQPLRLYFKTPEQSPEQKV